MDSIARIYERYLDLVAALGESHYHLVVRATLAYGFACLACLIPLRRGVRSVMVQTFCLVFALMLAAAIPVHHLRFESRVIQGWFFMLCVLLLVFLPGILPSLLVPTAGLQKKLRIASYLILLAFFILN